MKFRVILSIFLTSFSLLAKTRFIKEKTIDSEIFYYDIDDNNQIDYVIEKKKDRTVSYFLDGKFISKTIVFKANGLYLEEQYKKLKYDKNFILKKRITQKPFNNHFSQQKIETFKPEGDSIIQETLINNSQSNQPTTNTFNSDDFIFDFGDNPSISIEERIYKTSGKCYDGKIQSGVVSLLEGKGFGNLDHILSNFFQTNNIPDTIELIDCETLSSELPGRNIDDIWEHKMSGGTKEDDEFKKFEDNGICPGEMGKHGCDFDPGTKIETLIKQSLDQGISCLSKTNKMLAAKMLAVTQGHIPDKKLKINCHEQGTESLGIASLPCTKFWPAIKIKMPGNYIASKNPPICTCLSDDNFKATFFHELIHTLGYPHSNVPDLATVCETACFSKTDVSVPIGPLKQEDSDRIKISKELCKSNIIEESQEAIYWKKYIDSLSDQQNPKNTLPSYFKGLHYYWMNGKYEEKVLLGILNKIIVLKNNEGSKELQNGHIWTSESDLLSVYMLISPEKHPSDYTSFVNEYVEGQEHLNQSTLKQVKDLGRLYRSGDFNSWLIGVQKLPQEVRKNFTMLQRSHCKRNYLNEIKTLPEGTQKAQLTQLCMDLL